MKELPEFKQSHINVSDFNIKEDTLNIIHCVYFLFDNNRLVYVGACSVLFVRIITHLRNKKFDSFNYIEYPADINVWNEEKLFIYKYLPPYNYTKKRNSMFIFTETEKYDIELIADQNNMECAEFIRHVVLSYIRKNCNLL